MSELEAALSKNLEALDAQHLYRRRRTVTDYPVPGEEPVARVDGRDLLIFCSNDYLGLSRHPKIAEAFRDAAERYGVGSGSAHLVTGHTSEHHALEEELADFVGRPRALLFSTGYMANLGVATALLGRGDTIFEDRLNHASLLDAGRLCGARLFRYRHADVGSLQSKLDSGFRGRAMIVTDGVFSMDGDLAPLKALSQSASRAGGFLMVDDAHGLGVLGATGAGSLEHFALSEADVSILMGTLGKAFGTFGAFVAGSNALIESLIQKARTYIYTTAPPAAIAAASRKALELVRAETWRRDRVLAHVRRFRRGAAELGLELEASETPIQPLIVGNAERALALSTALMQAGFWVTAIRPPTVPRGTARLRITLSAAHEDAHIDQLLETLSGLELEQTR